MKKTLIIVFFFLLSTPACKVNADSCGYIVKFNSDTFIADNRFEKLFDNTYRISGMNYLYGLEDLIEYVEPDDEVELINPVETKQKNRQLSISKKTETINWQAEMIKADFAWDLATYGNGVNVAIIDSGCNQHEDIIANLAGGYNYILDTDDYSDNIGHGTHVAGIIAAAHNDFGIMGIAPKTNIFALKCFDSDCETTVSMLAKAIKSAVDDYDCKIINMSLGLKNDRETLHEAIQYATKKGAIIIAAAGNDGNEQMYYPAGYEEVIGVGSVGKYKKKSYFSQYNSSVFVTAPGESYKSLSGEDDYETQQGTSQATPVVAAAAAILLSADSSMSLQRFKELIVSCSEDLGDTGYDTEYGYGLLDIQGMFDTIIDDYYVSPVNDDGVVVYNKTADDLSAAGIWGEYAEDDYIGGKINDIFVPSKEKLNIPCIETENELKFFLWDSLITMRPLVEARTTVLKTDIKSDM